MKYIRSILFVNIIGLVLLSLANAQMPSGVESQKNANGANSERRRKLPVMVEEYTDLNKITGIQNGVYELRCRGINSGGTLTFETINSQIHSSGAEILTIELSFSPSLNAAGANSGGLQPGECSWIDRPLSGVNRAGEPWRVRFQTPANAQLKQKQHGSEVNTSPTAAENYPDAITIPSYLKSQNHYWSFFVQNTGQGYLQAQSHRHWKKLLEDNMIPKDKILIRSF